MEPKAITEERVVTYFNDIFWYFTRISKLLPLYRKQGEGL